MLSGLHPHNKENSTEPKSTSPYSFFFPTGNKPSALNSHHVLTDYLFSSLLCSLFFIYYPNQPFKSLCKLKSETHTQCPSIILNIQSINGNFNSITEISTKGSRQLLSILKLEPWVIPHVKPSQTPGFAFSPCKSLLPAAVHRSTNFFCKAPNSKYLQLCGP